ncbi:MAG: hypothetical protein J6W73_09265 [Verrucomicrobia bacterium]|nr:hypothetical protein [Verrucomicrobiota bacterium]
MTGIGNLSIILFLFVFLAVSISWIASEIRKRAYRELILGIFTTVLACLFVGFFIDMVSSVKPAYERSFYRGAIWSIAEFVTEEEKPFVQETLKEFDENRKKDSLTAAAKLSSKLKEHIAEKSNPADTLEETKEPRINTDN